MATAQVTFWFLLALNWCEEFKLSFLYQAYQSGQPHTTLLQITCDSINQSACTSSSYFKTRYFTTFSKQGYLARLHLHKMTKPFLFLTSIYSVFDIVPAIFLMSLFLILSLLVTPRTFLEYLISQASIFFLCFNQTAALLLFLR